MTKEQMVLSQAVIAAAKRIERAAQYGVDTTTAHREYDLARAALARTRYGLAGGAA